MSAYWAVAALSWAASYVLVFKGLSLVAPLVLVSLQAVIGAVVVAGVGLSRRGADTLKRQIDEAWNRLGLGPIAWLCGFYALQVILRYTEGQSGTNVLFILGFAPLFVLAIGARHMRPRSAFLGAVACGIAVLGAAAILANWERPSSLSPFVFFPKEETLLVGAALCWAGFIASMRRAGDVDALASTVVVLGVSGFLLGVAAVGSGGPSAFLLDVASIRLVVFLGVLGGAAGVYSWTVLVRIAPTPLQAASSVFAAPALLSVVIFLDQMQGLSGPNPMIAGPVVTGSILVVVGIALVWAIPWWDKRTGAVPEGMEPTQDVTVRRRASAADVAVIVLAASGLLAAAIALVLPVQSSVIDGKQSNGTPFAATWTTPGYEAVGAWLLIAAAAITVFLAWEMWARRLEWAQLAAGVVTVFALLISAPVVSDSVFVAWHSWIPAEIQHAIGTPYVALTQERIANLAFPAVEIVVTVTLVAMIVKILWKQRSAS